jgi:phage-related protein
MSYGPALTEDHGVEQQRFGDNYSQASQRGIQYNRQVWQVGWQQLSPTDYRTLRDFFRDLGTDYFTWTPPDEDAPLKWRIQRNTFTGNLVAFESYTASAVFEQAFDP